MAPDDLAAISALPQERAVPRDVRQAIACMRQAMARGLTASELARVCGVPERTLHRHFVAFMGHAPLVHFRRMRLAAARSAMLAPGDGAASVTEIATRFGFAHLGRFSSDYARCYGEPPSATLARGRAADTRENAAGALPNPAMRRQAPSLAILPFRIDAGRLEERAFVEALAERIAAALCRAHGFSVRLARPTPGAPEREARAIGARYCLTGHLFRVSDGRVRVVARLLDLAEGELHLWGDAYEGAMADLGGLQDRVVEAVTRAIRPSIEEAEIDCARRKPAQNLGGRDLVLRAMPLVLAADPISASRALRMLEEAMALDADDAAPVALAAWCRMQRVIYHAKGDLTDERALAQRLADRAGALDPLGDPLVLTARSGVAMAFRRRAEAEALLGRARAIDPGFGWAWERSGWVCANFGEAAPAMARFRQALALTGPRAPAANRLAGMGAAFLCAGRYDQAAHWFARALVANPGAVWLNKMLAPTLLFLDRRQEALRSVDRLRRTYPGMTLSLVIGTLKETLKPREESLAALGLPVGSMADWCGVGVEPRLSL